MRLKTAFFIGLFFLQAAFAEGAGDVTGENSVKWISRSRAPGLEIWRDQKLPGLVVVKTVSGASKRAMTTGFQATRLAEALRFRTQILSNFNMRQDILSSELKSVRGTTVLSLRGQYFHTIKARYVAFREMSWYESGRLVTFLMTYESPSEFRHPEILSRESAFKALVFSSLGKVASLEIPAEDENPFPRHAVSSSFFRFLLATKSYAETSPSGASMEAGSCVPQGLLGSALDKLCQGLQESEMCKKFAQANPTRALDCKAGPEKAPSTWDYVKACGAGVTGDIGQIYDFAKMLVGAVINGEQTASKVSAEVAEFASTAGAYVMSEYDRNYEASSAPFRSTKALAGVAANLFQGIIAVVGELLESEIADLACQNSKSRMEAICAKIPYYIAGAGAAILLKRLAQYYSKMKRAKALGAVEKDLKGLSREERVAKMDSLGDMSPEEREKYAAQMIQSKTLTDQQKAGLEQAHNIGEGKGYFEYSKSELRDKKQALMDAGFTDTESNILIRSGAAGSPSTKSLSSMTRMEGGAYMNDALERGDYKAYQSMREELSERGHLSEKPTLNDVVGSKSYSPGGGQIEEALERDLQSFKKENSSMTGKGSAITEQDAQVAWIKENQQKIDENNRYLSGDRTEHEKILQKDLNEAYGDRSKWKESSNDMKRQVAVLESLEVRYQQLTYYPDSYARAYGLTDEGLFLEEKRLQKEIMSAKNEVQKSASETQRLWQTTRGGP